MFALSLLVGVVGVTAAFNQNFTENQRDRRSVIVGGAHFNQIDFRYPNWVVDPRPPCTSEGVFPHPRSPNCDWYYRCVARVGVPIYATFYFQCEPGTMFEDDLDQCVWPHSGYQCQGGPPTTRPPPPSCPSIQSAVYSSCKNYEVCGGSPQYLCRQCTSPTGVEEFCSRGQLMNMATGRCVDIPESCPCTQVQNSCGKYEVCGGGSQNMCRQEKCGGVTKNYCSRGQLKNMATGRCEDIPAKGTPLQSSCGSYTVCGGGSQYLCKQEQCPSVVKNYCSFGQLKDMNTGICVVKPEPCTVDGPGTNCKAFDCKSVEVGSGSFCTTKRICENERCTRGQEDPFVRRMCGGQDQVYDLDNKKCISRPSENTCNRCDIQTGPIPCCNQKGEAKNCRLYDLCQPSSDTRTLCDCNGCGVDKLWDPKYQVCVDKTSVCPSLKCVFRNTNCKCYNDKSLCTGCFMRGDNFIHVSQFCQNPAANAQFYHVEKESCLYESPVIIQKPSSGHCPRPAAFGVLGGVRGESESFAQPALTCSLRDDAELKVIRCWSDNKVDVE